MVLVMVVDPDPQRSALIWVVGSGSGSRILIIKSQDSDPHLDPDPDPHSYLAPDPHSYRDPDPQLKKMSDNPGRDRNKLRYFSVWNGTRPICHMFRCRLKRGRETWTRWAAAAAWWRGRWATSSPPPPASTTPAQSSSWSPPPTTTCPTWVSKELPYCTEA